MSEPSLVDKYQRRKSRSTKNVKDKKLRANLKRLDEKFNDAAKSAANTEYLLVEDGGFLEAEGEVERTYKFTQDEIKQSTDVSTARKAFDLKLDQFGPYVLDYTRSGNSLLLGGLKGHIAAFNWKQGKLSAEINVNETVQAVKWLQSNDQFFAVAQKKFTYIYDASGVEIHCLRNHVEATQLEYLPYHFLLASAGNTGFIKYQDVSTGQLVAELRTKLGPTGCLAQNPCNAVLHAGHSNGTVTLWAPNMSMPLVKVLSCQGPVRSIAVNRDGRYMAVAGADRSLKIWDIRNFKELHSYYSPTPASSVSISETGQVAVGWGPHVQIWKDILTLDTSAKQSAPYMNHLLPGSQISQVKFCPFEDILGLGHAGGFSSIIVPGSGEANFDSLEVNPYAFATKQGRRDIEVRELLNKLQPDMISLNPDMIGTINARAPSERQQFEDSRQQKQRQLQLQHLDPERQKQLMESEKLKIKASGKGKNSSLRTYLRKQTANVIDQRKLRVLANLQKEKKLRQQRVHRLNKGLSADDADLDQDTEDLGILSRFK